MNVSVVSVWEQLANLGGWSELAASCDASPFTWPTYCLPWWYEAGRGTLCSIVVEESGLLVGLALLHDNRASRFGSHAIRRLGEKTGMYWQLLAAGDRQDVIELLWERLVGLNGEIRLSAVPTHLAERYTANTPGAVTASQRAVPGYVQVVLDRTTLDGATSAPCPDLSSVRTVRDPEECLHLLTWRLVGDGWGMGAPGTRSAAFFASAADACARAGRMTLHIEDRPGAPSAGVLVLHGAGTSAVWRCAGRVVGDTRSCLVEAVSIEAASRGSKRVVWPSSVGVPGEPFPLTDLVRPRSSAFYLERASGFARRVAFGRPSR